MVRRSKRSLSAIALFSIDWDIAVVSRTPNIQAKWDHLSGADNAEMIHDVTQRWILVMIPHAFMLVKTFHDELENLLPSSR